MCQGLPLPLFSFVQVDVLEYYDAVVRSTNQTFPIPAVLRVSCGRNWRGTVDHARRLNASSAALFQGPQDASVPWKGTHLRGQASWRQGATPQDSSSGKCSPDRVSPRSTAARETSPGSSGLLVLQC